MVQQHKTCTVCGETKPLDGFHKDKSRKDGVYVQCKPCVAERNRRYREENPEEVRERNRRYREENREKMAERNRRYHEENRDEILERQRRYREENREKELERVRRYREENQENMTELHRRYREENQGIINSKRAKRRREEQELSTMFATDTNGTPYLPGEDALIMADNGMTIYQKAIELGRTHASVGNRRKKLLAKGGVSNDSANA